MKTLTYDLDGLHCGNCAVLIDNALTAMPGVIQAQTSVTDARTVVYVDTQLNSAEEVRQAITIFGFGGTPQPA